MSIRRGIRLFSAQSRPALYLIQFECGMLKIGMSANPRSRFGGYFGRHLPMPTRIHLFSPPGGGVAIVRLIERIAVRKWKESATLARGYEYFTGIQFDEAVADVREIAASHADSNSPRLAINRAIKRKEFRP